MAKSNPDKFKQQIASLTDERDGLLMRCESLVAKINAQTKQIEVLSLKSQKAVIKAEALKELMSEIIELQKTSFVPDQLELADAMS